MVSRFVAAESLANPYFSRFLPSHPALSRVSQLSCLFTTKITLRRIFSKHVLLKRTQFQLTQAQLAEAVGTSHGWIQKIESGKKMPGFFLAIKLAVFLEIDMNSFLKDLMEASGTPITASKRQESLVHTHAAKESGDTEVTGHVQV